MADETLLGQFHQLIESEITESTRDGAGTGEFRETVFTEMVTDELSASGVLESPVGCHYESGKAAAAIKVSGYSVPEEDSRLDLFVTLYYGTCEQTPSVNGGDVDTAFRKLERFLGKALAGLHTELDPSGNQYQMAEHIHRLKGQIDRVSLYVFTNARLAQRKEKERKPDLLGMGATYEVWDLERFRRLRESGASSEPVIVDLRHQPAGGLPCVMLDHDECGFRTCITVFPGTLLHDLYDEYGARLLELNVRSYLQAKSRKSVNFGILDTLKTNPQDFMAYNNGITVVAEKIDVGLLKDGTRGILELKGMQIVNGGQTTASIHRAGKEFGTEKLARVLVQGKITVVDPSRFQEIVPLIARFSNTQNKVTQSDLSANHPFHIGMERVSRREWTPDQRTMWFYERARGSYQTAKLRDGNTPAKRRQFEERFPNCQRFTKEDLARFENAWRSRPDIVSRGGQKSFVHFMEGLEPYADGWEPTADMFHAFVAKGILFREAQRIVRQDAQITAYQINVVAYTVSLLCEMTARRIDLESIWRMQKTSPAISATIASWAPVVYQRLPEYATSHGRHVGESFKQVACWDQIRTLDLKVPRELDEELVAAIEGDAGAPATRRDGRPLTTKDQNNIARCRELGEKEWLTIADWGQKAGNFKDWERGIARSLAGYAAEHWAKLPSDKQAKHGARMIETVKSAGVL